MKRYKIATLLALLFSCLLPAYALPGTGFAKKAVVEAIEQITRAASKEGSESAAKKAAREMAERVGKGVPEIEALLTKYGDDMGIVLRNEQRAKLFATLGDDAAQAFIRNGNAAENVLTHIPSADMARTIHNLNRTDMRHLDALVQRGQVSATDAATWGKAVKERGTWVLSYAWKHPKTTAAALLATAGGGYAISHPEDAVTCWNTLETVWQFVCEHPYWSAAILILILALPQLLMKGVWRAIRWTFVKLGSGLWSMIKIIFCKKKG